MQIIAYFFTEKCAITCIYHKKVVPLRRKKYISL